MKGEREKKERSVVDPSSYCPLFSEKRGGKGVFRDFFTSVSSQVKKRKTWENRGAIRGLLSERKRF